MRALADHYADLDSPLHRMHPVCKWIAFGAVAAGTVSVDRWWPAAVSLVLAIVAVGVAALPVKLVLARVGAVALFLGAFVLLSVATSDDRAGAFASSSVVSLKCLAVVAWTTLLLGAMSTSRAFAALRDMHVPARLVEQLSLAYRYVFAQSEELAVLRRSAACRGFRPAVTARGLKTVGQLSGALIVRSLDRSRRIHDAMIVRGYDGQARALASALATRSDAAKLLVAVVFASLLAATRWL